MANNRRVVKFRKQRTINIGVIIFLILFLYIAINVYLYFTKDHMAIYEVQSGSNMKDNLVTALILREEKLVNTDKAGYISYFKKEGARVAKNSPVFSVNESMQLMDTISGSDTIISLDEKDNAQFKYEINKFHTYYTDNNFSPVYVFKEDAQSTVMDLLNVTMSDKGNDRTEDSDLSGSYDVEKCAETGIITYYSDNFENITEDTITSDLFNQESYIRTSLRSTEMVRKNSPVYKLITSENWSLLLPLNKEQYQELTGKERLSFTIKKDDYRTSAPLSLFQKGKDYYAKLDMDKLLANYLEDRYLDLELHFSSDDGLKIPLSSIVEKDFYLVPEKFFTVGGDSGSKGLVKESYSENGEVNLTFVKADKYYQDENYCYVDTRLFSPGTWLQSTSDGDRYQLSQTAKLTGVYNVNMGYAVFKRIEIIYQNTSYCIVNKDTEYGLSLYDHIALDGSTAVEQAIIY